jgi:5-formyltetrahydrofolate cyclo-ligase
MTKNELRAIYKQKRTALSQKERLRLDDLLLIQFQQYPFPTGVQTLFSYLPIETHAEINTHLITDFLRFRIPGLQIACPFTNFEDNTMKAVLFDDETSFTLNRYGIPEPVNGTVIAAKDIDMVFVPLLAFDVHGYRVGYGKGFYDRFLPGCRTDTLKLGFSYFDPINTIEDINQFDVPLNTGFSPHAIYEF